MIKYFIRHAWHKLVRQRIFTLINLIGLGLGTISCIIMYLIASYELSFDTFHPDSDRIFRIVGSLSTSSGEVNYFNNLPQSAQMRLRSEVSGIQETAGFYPYWGKIQVQGNSRAMNKFDCADETGNWWTSIIVTNQGYFKILKYEWLAGNSDSALDNPFSVVLSERKAKKYFGSLPPQEVVGRQIIYNDSIRVKVVGIVKDWGRNTDFPFTDFISLTSFQNGNDKGTGLNTMVKLSDGVSPKNIERQLRPICNEVFLRHSLEKRSLQLQPMADMHFNSNFVEDGFRKADLRTIYSIVIIGIFILVLAVVNFVNLSTAISIERTKEIGIRKALGSGKRIVAIQILIETFLLTFISVAIAVLFVNPILFSFREFVPTGVSFSFFSLSNVGFLLLLIVATTFLSGIYPASVLAAIPSASLKPGAEQGKSKMSLRKTLVIFQFVIAMIFIVCIVVMKRQLTFVRFKDLGYNAAEIITIRTPLNESRAKIKVLFEKLKRIPEIKMLSMEAFPPVGDAGDLIELEYKSRNPIKLMVAIDEGDENFLSIYDMKLVAGRALIRSDSLQELIINETLMRLLGFEKPEAAIGKYIYSKGSPYPIVGVVCDYHIKSLHQPITPVCIGNIPDYENDIAIKVSSGGKSDVQVNKMLKKIEEKWSEIYPADLFSPNFLDEYITKMYENDRRTVKLVNYAMVLAIAISSIGLFGLAKYTVEVRTKEISVRKVLGASTFNIFFLLTREILLLVTFAVFIAAPIALIIMTQWLQSFAYRINISWQLITISGIFVITIAMLSIFSQTIKAANSKIIKGIRGE